MIALAYFLAPGAWLLMLWRELVIRAGGLLHNEAQR